MREPEGHEALVLLTTSIFNKVCNIELIGGTCKSGYGVSSVDISPFCRWFVLLCFLSLHSHDLTLYLQHLQPALLLLLCAASS